MGTLATQIGLLPNLASLSLEDTSLSGTLPTEIGFLSRLNHITLARTSVEGNIPESLYSGLQNLEVLDIEGCHFSGTISSMLSRLTSLSNLRIANNQFTGTLPDVFGSLAKLQQISLQGNNFTNTQVPQSLCEQHGPNEAWEMVADCTVDEATGVTPMACPSGCCTVCCDQRTKVCLPT